MPFYHPYLKEIMFNFFVFRYNSQKLIKKNKIEKYITYFANLSHGITCRTFLNSNIDVYSTGDPISYLKKLSKASPNAITNYKDFKKKFNLVKFKNSKIRLAKKEFRRRFKGRRKDLRTK